MRKGTSGARSGRARRGGHLAALAETVLWTAGGLLLGVAMWMAADAAWYQLRAGEELRAAALAPAPLAPVATPALTGAPIARLSIPRLDLDVVVAEGDSDDVLRRAVGRVPSGARLGDAAGNVTLAGHRDTFFRPLEEIRTGDRIVVERGAARDVYLVEWAAVVDPSRVEVQGDPGYAALTLVTCYPFRYVGEAPYRFVVRARRVDGPAGETAAG
jgi:sortase A